jgi:hypothetical protein
MTAPIPFNERRIGLEIVEPKQWPCDEGKRREPVVDRNLNDRVVRHVGWRTCMNCCKWFFSPDVKRIRLHESCSQPSAEW